MSTSWLRSIMTVWPSVEEFLIVLQTSMNAAKRRSNVSDSNKILVVKVKATTAFRFTEDVGTKGPRHFLVDPRIGNKNTKLHYSLSIINLFDGRHSRQDYWFTTGMKSPTSSDLSLRNIYRRLRSSHSMYKGRENPFNHRDSSTWSPCVLTSESPFDSLCML